MCREAQPQSLSGGGQWRRSRRGGARLPWGSPSRPLLSDAALSSRGGRCSHRPSPEVGIKAPSPTGPVPFPYFHRHPKARPCACVSWGRALMWGFHDTWGLFIMNHGPREVGDRSFHDDHRDVGTGGAVWRLGWEQAGRPWRGGAGVAAASALVVRGLQPGPRPTPLPVSSHCRSSVPQGPVLHPLITTYSAARRIFILQIDKRASGRR